MKPGSGNARRSVLSLQVLQMPRSSKTGFGCDHVEIPEPCPGAAFECGAVAAEAGVLRRAGGDVSHRVEGGVGVFSEFFEMR